MDGAPPPLVSVVFVVASCVVGIGLALYADRRDRTVAVLPVAPRNGLFLAVLTVAIIGFAAFALTLETPSPSG